MRDEPKAGSRCPTAGANLEPTKGVGSIKTAGRWSWKSKSAKECVTTHLPNQLARKWMALKSATHTRPSGQQPGLDEPAHPGKRLSGGRVQRLEEHRRVRGVGAPGALENPEDRVRPRLVVLITHQVSKVNSLWSMEQCRQGKSAKWIRNRGKGLARGGAGHGGPSRTRRLSVDCSSCSSGGGGSSAMPAGTDWERPLGGAFPASNSRLSELKCGQGNPTV
ncbi:hypothetical protein H6P81_021408 [Aristolochia fimbriata]|uniref:Uncharacterized protein n=1 Tax=Aristolochia fimbriata TaxID=158543 RepID=A0AAV7DT18_ARIFI|nr:hypothetical protein H6P81_021408 [Aristolochia fimbriata]